MVATVILGVAAAVVVVTKDLQILMKLFVSFRLSCRASLVVADQAAEERHPDLRARC